MEQRWFSANENPKKNPVKDENSNSDIYIERDLLIQMNCKQERHYSVEYYRVIFYIYIITNGTLLRRKKSSGAIPENQKNAY